LSKDRFWQIIDEARETTGYWQDMQEPVIETLTKLDAQDIVRFKQIYNEYQDLAYKGKLWAAAAVMHGGCSDDKFIDFRAWLIAQGKEVYLNALANPDSLAKLETVIDYAVEKSLTKYEPSSGYFYSSDFESFSYAANEAYKYKLGNEADIYDMLNTPLLTDMEFGEIESEITYASDIDAKWGGIGASQEEADAALKKLCPELYKCFRGNDPPERAAEKESVLDQIKQSRQSQASEKQSKNKNKKHKSDPDL